MEGWQSKLKNLFSCLAQSELEEAFDIMNIDSTQEDEIEAWISAIDSAITASSSNDQYVVEIINSSGYVISRPIEARPYFTELGYIYLRGLRNNVKNT
ncbi:hypothetical protein [Spartinivicinus poritis]|uniref:PH domain-containing protein n=1 Tax=Spartinivicinus poritis TaxID=2994640 RepID=A0ABT5UBG1_9GAMM|nr:hypothetical protein [Spartinivicinus sp. A2-2]MDE1463719.1 hypothetical protein [Spartinivicinus sp. A2-2]